MDKQLYPIFSFELLKECNDSGNFNIKYTMEPKKCYFTISDNTGEYAITMTLDGCMEWIKNDDDNYGEYVPEDERAEYTITPVWMTEEEFDNLPEADI